MKLAALLFTVVQFITPDAAAQGSGPEELVRQITADVLAAVQSDQALAAGDRRKALALAEAKILPHVDFREATRLAVNRAWASATTEQQDRIVAEFRSMLVRIYAASVDAYRGQMMRVLPLRLEPGAIEATVRNQYISPGQSPVPVDYAMRKTPEGWKVYDITVGGVSLVLTFRSEFEQITRQSGIEGLIKRMGDKNRAG